MSYFSNGRIYSYLLKAEHLLNGTFKKFLQEVKKNEGMRCYIRTALTSVA